MLEDELLSTPERLKLPREVLEKIYYKNAMRIYPRVAGALEELGLSVARKEGDFR